MRRFRVEQRHNRPPRFVLGEDVRLLDPETLTDIEPGSGRSGVLALGGRNPLGYYKDAAKTETTFKLVDGDRMSIPGDHAIVDADGSLRLLGRGLCASTQVARRCSPKRSRRS